MATVQLERPLTYGDLLTTPDDGNCYEIINGVLFVSPAPSLAHQIVAASLYDAINDHARRHRLGRCLFAPLDVRLSPFDIVEPDILFLKQDQLSTYRKSGHIEGAPTLVVEIISPSSATTDTVNKAALYARAGIPEYWLADPARRMFRMLVLQPDGTYRDAAPEKDRYHSAVLDGLVIDPAQIFEDLGD